MTTKDAKAIAKTIADLRGSMGINEHGCLVREMSRTVAELCSSLSRDAFERRCNGEV